ALRSDPGAATATLLLPYSGQAGRPVAPGARRDYQAWILAQAEAVWTEFAARFLALWNSDAAAGDAYPKALFADELGRRAFVGLQYGYMRRLFADTLGFAAAKMIRRILGLAHVLDLESIKDPDRRAACERRALRLGRALMVERARFGSIQEVTQAARDVLKAMP